jgi:hypothetical protein
MPLGEGGGSVPDLGRESRPPGLVLPPFSKLSLEDQEIGRGELRGRRHRPSACMSRRHPVPHAYRRDTPFPLPRRFAAPSAHSSICQMDRSDPIAFSPDGGILGGMRLEVTAEWRSAALNCRFYGQLDRPVLLPCSRVSPASLSVCVSPKSLAVQVYHGPHNASRIRSK